MKVKKIEDFKNGAADNPAVKNSDGCDFIYEMASVGYFGDKNTADCSAPQMFKVFVNGKEGNIPHFHIWDDSTDGKEFHTCVCIEKAAYFHHTGKEDVFDSKQKKKLVEFLKASPRNSRYKTHFEYICSMWNDNNPTKKQVDENSSIPDYMNL